MVREVGLPKVGNRIRGLTSLVGKTRAVWHAAPESAVIRHCCYQKGEKT